MPEEKPQTIQHKLFRLLVVALIVGLAIYLTRNLNRWHVCQVLIGFGAVIFVHELGHFVAAKSVGIMVEAFSLGFGPVVFGIKRVAGGWQIRDFDFLPQGKAKTFASDFQAAYPDARSTWPKD